jgi:hypothetical protein
MSYSEYAIQRRPEMTFQQVILAMAAGALALAAVARRFEVSPGRVFGLAAIAAVVTLALGAHVGAQDCGVASAGDWFFEASAVLALILCGTATLVGVAEGVRLGKAGDHGEAIARYVGCPLAGAAGVGVVFFALLLAIGHCLD